MNNDSSKKPGPLLPSWAGGLSQAQQPPSPYPPYPSGGLSQFFSRPVVEGLYYNGKIIQLDGFRWVGCRFDGCTLLVNTPNFELINCVIDPSTMIRYGNETMKIVRLYNSRNDWVSANWPHLAPTRNPDGTITISGEPA